MSITNIYQDAPYFVDDVEFSGADGNVLRTNAIFIDAITQQPIIVFPNGLYRESQTGFTLSTNTGEQPYFWRGAFQYRSGMQSAVYDIGAVPVTNERLRIYHKRLTDAEPGTQVYDAVMPSSATITINIADDGFTDGEIIETRVVAHFPGPTYPKTGIYITQNAYTTPVSGSVGSYPGVPSFGVVNATRLNQLSNAQDWIINRLALLPRVPLHAAQFALGTHKSLAPNPYVIWTGIINKNNNQNTLRGVIDYHTFNAEEYVRVLVHNGIAYQSGALGQEEEGTLEFTFDMSGFANNTNYNISIQQYVASGQGNQELHLYGNTTIGSRFVLRALELTNTRSYYSPSSAFSVLESMTYATLKTRLNNFVSGTTTGYNRIINNANPFDRARMFRQKVGVDRFQITSLNHLNLPTLTRIGERFVVAGKDVKIAWGGFSLKNPITETPNARDLYEFAHTEQLTGSEKVEAKEGFFDKFDGLFVGTQYYLLGQDIVFFSEYLR